MADADINARELVQRLWAEADGELLAPDPVVPALPVFESPEHDADLRYLNHHWQIDPSPEPGGGAGAGAGAIKDRAKDRMAATVLGVLHRYFEEERNYLAHGVRFSNRMAEWGGRMAREVRLVQQSLSDESRRLSERQDVLHRRLEERIEALEARLRALEERGER